MKFNLFDRLAQMVLACANACGLKRPIFLLGLFVLAATACLIAPPVRADVAQINLSNLAFAGTGACPGTCETFNVSFEWNTATDSIVSGSMTISSLGAFGQFTFDGTVGSALGTAFLWSDPQGVLLAFVTPCSPGQFGSGCALALNQVVLTCISQACAKDFGINWQHPYVHPNGGSVSDPVSTPEPSLLLQLFLGFLSLALFHWWFSRRRDPVLES